MRARLFCKTGDLAGADHEIGGEATIGRSAQNTVALAASVISESHARIFFDADIGRYVLEDLKSKNGTRLDGIPVDGRLRLNDLHVVTLGERHDFIFVTLPEPDADEARHSEAATTSKTLYEPASVLEMPALSDAPAAQDEGAQPSGGPTVYEPPSALEVPSLEEPPAPRDGAAATTSKTHYEPASVLEMPMLSDAPASQDESEQPQGGQTVYEPPSALELPPLEAGQPGAVDPEAATVAEPSPVQASARAVLEVTVADGSSFRVELGEGRHHIGRAPEGEVWIDDRTLSRRQAVLTVAGDAVTIEDQDSRNGTFMNGSQLTAPVRLHVGDVVTFGDQVTARLVDP